MKAATTADSSEEVKMRKFRQTAKQRAALIAAVMVCAAQVEGKRQSRTLSANDVELLLDACQRHDGVVKAARVYGGYGFVPNSYRYAAPVTIAEAGWFLPVVGVTDAKRPGGRGALLTINGRAA